MPITPNMNLVQPSIGNTPSPTWASDLNNDMSTIDSHDHSAGKGVPVTPDGLNISADLPFGSNNATELKTCRYVSQNAALSDPADLQCSYAVGDDGDLYWNDANGNQIQITASGGVAGSPGSISSLVSPAAATWVAASSTFVWTRSSGVGANMDSATLVLRYPGSYPSPSGNYIAIQAPSSLATGYAMTLPATLPAATSILQMDTSGNVSNVLVVDNSTLEISSNTLRIKDSGVSTAKIADGAVTRVKQAAVGQQVSSVSGAFSTSSAAYVDVTGLTITITTTGRPVKLSLQGVSGTLSALSVSSIATSSATAGFRLLRDGVTGVGETGLAIVGPSAGVATSVPVSSFEVLDVVAAGTYTYQFQAKLVSGSVSAGVSACVLVAYEL